MANSFPIEQQDPPLPNRVSAIREMTAEDSRAATAGMLAMGAVL